jgi:hypothetical protein
MKPDIKPTSKLLDWGDKTFTEAAQTQHPLKGLFFRRFEAGQLHWEGQVLEIINDEFLLVQRYSNPCAGRTSMHLVSIAETRWTDGKMHADLQMTSGWFFYNSRADWIQAANQRE